MELVDIHIHGKVRNSQPPELAASLLPHSTPPDMTTRREIEGYV